MRSCQYRLGQTPYRNIDWMLLSAFMMFSGTGIAEDVNAMRQVVVEYCDVQFAEFVDVPSLDAGQLTRVEIEEGHQVKADQVIAELDSTLLASQRIAAEAKRAQIATKLEDQTELRYAEIVLQEAVNALESDERQSKRTPGSITSDAITRSRLAVERANLEQERVKRQKQDLATTLRLQELEIGILDLQLAKLRARSSLTGVVLTRYRNRGEWVDKGEPIAKIARMDQLRVSAYMAEADLSPRKAVGTPVAVQWHEGKATSGHGTEASGPYTLRGKIVSIDPQMMSDQTYRINVMIENRQVEGGWLLLPGRSVTMTVFTSPEEANVERL